jgi:Periplasmic copper-binding protein (NosD)
MSVEWNEGEVVPRAGLVITESALIAPGHHLLVSPSGDPYAAAVTIRGDDLTVDFGGAELLGTTRDTPPDRRVGTAIRVEGRNVTIKNARARGYKVGLIAREASGLRVLDSDFSYNWKQHLGSTTECEDLGDWMSYHQNERDEWLRYGAGIYLRRCGGFEVRNVRVTGGQCGLMLTGCDAGLAWNNDFSFLSGLGIGLYRSSGNRIMHNRLDWCIRGYSHGVYNRGQDSAGILVYEQSCRNTIAYNSATHCGDGLFLWAGQATMDTGQGGSNDNLIYGNDFSHAATNGIEATFSRNAFANNLLRECWHGVWAGYSFESLFVHNAFADNEVGIAIEHGQANTINANVFRAHTKAIELWQSQEQNPEWSYPKHRDTPSRDYTIRDNVVDRAEIAIELRDTTAVTVAGNRFNNAGRVLKLGGDASGLRFENNLLEGISMDRVGIEPAPSNLHARVVETGPAMGWSAFREGTRLPDSERHLRPPALTNGMDPFLPEDKRRGRETIMMDEWGPYDFRSPQLWPEPGERSNLEAGRSHAGVLQFRLHGPPGRWRLVRAAGLEKVSPESGFIPGTLQIVVPPGRPVEVSLELEYVGEETIDALGNMIPAGTPSLFGYRSSDASSPAR